MAAVEQGGGEPVVDPMLTAFVGGCHVLHMDDWSAEEEPGSGDDGVVVAAHEHETDVVGVTVGEEFDLVGGMDGFYLMAAYESAAQDVPEALDVGEVGGRGETDTPLFGFLHAPAPQTDEGQMVGNGDGGGEASAYEPCIVTVEGVERFVGRVLIIYIGYGPIDEACGMELGAIVVAGSVHHLQHIDSGDVTRQNESAIGEALVAIDGMFALDIVGRQRSEGLAVADEEQGAVAEAVAVIVHETAVEEEGSVLRLGYQFVPLCLVGWCIGEGRQGKLKVKS